MNTTVFITSLSLKFNLNYSILVISENIIFDCRKREEIKHIEDVQNNSYTIIISLINFNSANDNLIKKLINENTNPNEFVYSFPDQLNYFPKNKISDKTNTNTGNNKLCSEYEKFYTKKSNDHLPEIILIFDTHEICLFGYPFTILEKAEIIQAGYLSSIDVIKYIEMFDRHSKINKRYGK